MRLYVAFAFCLVLLSSFQSVLGGSLTTTLDKTVQDNRIILSTTTKVQITVNNAVTNYCDGNLGLSSPEEKTLIENYNNKKGETIEIGPYEADTELIFSIKPHSFCSGHIYESTDISHARVYKIADNLWRIEWEDLPDSWPPDNDFDDLIITVRGTTAYPGYRQDVGDWSEDIYDHNNDPSDDVSRWGCAMTAIANLLAYYGARDSDPGTLNKWMTENNGYSPEGAVIWDSVNRYFPPASDVGIMNFDPPFGTRANLPAMQDRIEQNLAKGWPVIIEYSMPDSPSRSHYLVIVGITETAPGVRVYEIKDPLTSSDIKQIQIDDEHVLSARFYRPSDQVPRTSLIFYGLSPIDLMLVDEQGRRLGVNRETGEMFSEIPNGTYWREGDFWDPTGSMDSTQGGGLVVHVPDAQDGDYQLVIQGTGEGDYTIASYRSDDLGNTQKSIENGHVSSGTKATYNIQVTGEQTMFSVLHNLTIAAGSDGLVSDGSSSATISVTLLGSDSIPIPGQVITFVSSIGTLYPFTTTTDLAGNASANLTSTQHGIAIVTATTGLATEITSVNIHPISPTSVTIHAPSAVLLEETHWYTASMLPLTVTVPITYGWFLSGHLPIETSSLLITSAITSSWNTTGVQTITVSAANTGGIVTASHAVHVYAPAHASFSATPISGTAPLTVSFSNDSTGDYLTSEWDFGDGFTTTTNAPVHVYTQPGIYTVTLTVEGPGGVDITKAMNFIMVNPTSKRNDLYLPYLHNLPLNPVHVRSN